MLRYRGTARGHRGRGSISGPIERASAVGQLAPDQRADHRPEQQRAHHGRLGQVAEPEVLLRERQRTGDDTGVVAERLGYTVALGATGPSRDERKAVDDLLGYRIEALILIGPYLGPKQLDTLARQLPVVEIGRRINVPGVDSVHTADDRGMRQAVDHLVGLGHRAIVHVDGGTMPGANDRRRGYRTGMRRHGLDDHVRILPGDYTEESGAHAARELLVADRLPTAVLAGNDRCAHGLLDTLIRAGVQVPGDISIVGYDDSQIARLSFIDLTTVHQDAERMAALAVQAAAERLDDGRTTARDIVLEPTLVVRGTTGPPRSPP